MSRYFDWTASLKRFVRFDTARSEDVNDALDELTAGLDDLDLDVNRSIKLPSGTADQTLALGAGARANKVLAFDGSGNITVSTNDVDSSGASAVSAAASASSASTSASSASTSASTATTQAGIATAKASEASASASSASTSASTATTQAGIATTQAGTATTQAGIATTQAGIATTQASNASTSASTATTKAGEALTSASNAAASESAAATSASNAAASFDAFDDRYLGAKASDPTVDNDGAALLTGALYWNSGSGIMRAYNGSAWVNVGGIGDVTLNGTQTLTNKTLTSPVADVVRFAGQYNAGNSGASITLNFANGQKQLLTLTANTTVTLSFPGVGNYQVILTQDGTGSRTVTWSGVSRYVASATAPAINTSASTFTVVSLYFDGTNTWLAASKVNA